MARGDGVGDAVGFVVAARGDDDAGVAEGFISANGAADLKAVGARHEQVAEDDLGTMLADEFEAGVAIARVEHAPAVGAEDFAHEFAELRVVVNDEGGFHRGEFVVARILGGGGAN